MTKKVASPMVEPNVHAMDDISLTKLFILFAETRKAMAEQEAEIVRQVIARKDTVKMAGVTATYYKPANYRDYKLGGRDADQKVVEAHTEHMPEVAAYDVVDWKSVCDELGIEAPIVDTKPERVVVK